MTPWQTQQQYRAARRALAGRAESRSKRATERCCVGCGCTDYDAGECMYRAGCACQWCPGMPFAICSACCVLVPRAWTSTAGWPTPGGIAYVRGYLRGWWCTTPGTEGRNQTRTTRRAWFEGFRAGRVVWQRKNALRHPRIAEAHP